MGESKTIDWKKEDAEEKLYKSLDLMIAEKNDNEISIINITSSEFCDLMSVEDVTDFNGWQCDWWSYFDYKFVRFNVSGCAWYGTISISIAED